MSQQFHELCSAETRYNTGGSGGAGETDGGASEVLWRDPAGVATQGHATVGLQHSRDAGVDGV